MASQSILIATSLLLLLLPNLTIQVQARDKIINSNNYNYNYNSINNSDSNSKKNNNDGFRIPPSFYSIQYKLPICTTSPSHSNYAYQDFDTTYNQTFTYEYENQNNNKRSHNHRHLENNENDNNEEIEEQYYNDDAQNNDDADDASTDDYLSAFNADQRCVTYLVGFLNGTTNARDQCEGIKNAYLGAYCHVTTTSTVDDIYDHDDYFTTYNHFSCCESLRNYYDEYCEEVELLTNLHLFLITTMLLLCEVAKSFIKSHKWHWLPEAGGTILVGTFVGLVAHIIPSSIIGFSVNDLSFDDDLFMKILLPPIIFEAALSVDKKQFRKWLLPILLFAVLGTILSTFLVGYMVYYASLLWKSATNIPLIDSLIFGALISSVDPVAILSVLTSLDMTEQDTVYIMVFGESLLNDGIAITLFKALIKQFNRDEDDIVTADEILGAMADFLIVSFGSIAVGLICGCFSLFYFSSLRDKLSAPMEVASFFLWAGLPYYICDGLGGSGIVSLVTIGVFLDVFIAAPTDSQIENNIQRNYRNISPTNSQMNLFPRRRNSTGGANTTQNQTNYVDFGDNTPCAGSDDVFCTNPASIYSCNDVSRYESSVKAAILHAQQFRLSTEAEKHVRFVAHLFAQLSENCIFAYLGLFLFADSKVWKIQLIIISIISCVVSRGMMVWIICNLVWVISVIRRHFGWGCTTDNSDLTVDEVEDYHDIRDESEAIRTSKALQNRVSKRFIAPVSSLVGVGVGIVFCSHVSIML